MSQIIALITALWLTPIQTPTYTAIIPSESSVNAQILPPLHIFSEMLVFATSTPETPLKNDSTPSNVLCSCILYLRSLGIPIFGDADQIIPNATPAIGNVILLRYSNYHAALITKLTAIGFEIAEANYTKCTAGTRFIEFDDPAIRGFWTEKNLTV